ncbi:transposase [Hymenobacter cellulosivorans]|uniref:transposase n=1 Tax=Hymenobacter cellulosivorans TaxID=2932249 RepID=UPI0035CAFD37
MASELPPQRMGRPRRDDWALWNALLWMLCMGAAWRDLPARYGPWQTAYERFRCWSANGTFERVLAALHLRLDQDGQLDLDTWLVDSTTMCATKSAAGGAKKSPMPRAQSRWTDHEATGSLRRGGHAAGLAALGREAPRRAAVRVRVSVDVGASAAASSSPTAATTRSTSAAGCVGAASAP